MIELSKEEKRNMKRFELKDKVEYEIYLHELITRMYICINKQKKYLKKLHSYIEVLKVKNPNKSMEEIEAKHDDYSEFVDMISNIESNALNLMGDNQQTSISYVKFRDIIYKKKKKGTLKFEIRDLDEKTIDLMKDINRARNWANHVPESLLAAELKLIKEGKLKNHSRNPITIASYSNCTLEYMQSLYDNSNNFLKLMIKIHQNMKKDYSCLIGENVKIVRTNISTPSGVNLLAPAEISSQVQGIKGVLDE